MRSNTQRQHRMNVVLQMVMALVTAILLGQLWLFTVTLDVMENPAVSIRVAIAAAVCSLLACGSVWVLIRFFLSAEQAEKGERS